MKERLARSVGPARVDIAYERWGAWTDPPVLLIMGAGAQLVNWPDGFCRHLLSHGLQVVRFDNRDAGHSTHVLDAPAPDLAAVVAGDPSTAAYDLSDMAADTVGLLDVLGMSGAHLVGASLGAMIAQVVAIEHPGRVRSLTSIMATTGAADVGQAELGAISGFGPPPIQRREFVEWRVSALRAVASPGFPFDEADAAACAAITYDRGFDFMAMQRQCAAAAATGDRTRRLRGVTAPTLVVHGTDDLVCHVSGGYATAAAIPGADSMIIGGMGHGLPRDAWADMAARIAGLIQRAEAQRGDPAPVGVADGRRR